MEKTNYAEQALEERLGLVEAELLWRGTQYIAYGRWSMFQHLRATIALLEQWGQTARLQLAASMLGIYCQDVIDLISSPPTREFVRELIGFEAEILVYLSYLGRNMQSAPTHAIRGPLGIPQAIATIKFAETFQVSQSDVAELIVLHCASSANEGALDGSPTTWLSSVSAAARHALECGIELPGALKKCAKLAISAAQEAKLLSTYSSFLQSSLESPQAAHVALQEAAEVADVVGEPFILLGLCALSNGDSLTAANYGKRASEHLTAWATSWDKRLSSLNWLALAQFLMRASSCTGDALKLLSQQVHRIVHNAEGRPEVIYGQLETVELLGVPQINPALPQLPPHDISAEFEGFSDFDILPPRFSHYISGFRENVTRPGMNFYPGLASRPWWDAMEFDLCVRLRKMSGAIIAEFEGLDIDCFVSDERVLHETAGTSVFLLFSEGKKYQDNLKRCPLTAKLFEDESSAWNPSGAVYFSRIPPRTRHSTRRSYSNTSLRCYFGVHASNQSGIKVDGISERLRPGNSLVLDNSFSYDEWNLSDCEQSILVFDLWHPDLTSDEIALLNGLSRYIATVASRRI